MVDIAPNPAKKKTNWVPLILMGLGTIGALAAIYVGFLVLRYLVLQTTWFIPALIIVGKSLLLLAGLLIFIAYILLADRKICAARTWSGPGACCRASRIS
jgi:predicted MFS family arabinose efflux permease